jgi:hypothetical protein
MNSVFSTEKDEAIIIIAGQLLICFLECDDDSELFVLRQSIIQYLYENADAQTRAEQVQVLSKGIREFIAIMGRNYGWCPEAVDLLTDKYESVLNALFFDGDLASTLVQLRLVDKWSGITGAMRGLPVPLSLLDCALDIVLAHLASDEIKKGYGMVSAMFDDPIATTEIPLLKKLDDVLMCIVKKICFRHCLKKTKSHELKLAILAHFPKTDKDFAMKLGFVFKLLQARYSYMEGA